MLGNTVADCAEEKFKYVHNSLCMSGTECTPTVAALVSGKLTLEPYGDSPLLLQLPPLSGVTVRAQLTLPSGSFNPPTCSDLKFGADGAEGNTGKSFEFGVGSGVHEVSLSGYITYDRII